MIPILFEADETEFTSNGIGRLTDSISCKTTEERNGVFEVAFQYPTSGHLFDEIQERRIIFCTYDDTKDPQPFDIYGRSAPINGKVTFWARHIGYRLGKQTILPYSAGSAAAAFGDLKNHIVGGSLFDFWTDKTTVANFKLTVPKSVRACLGGSAGSMLDVYGGEYKWDKWTVKLYDDRGTDDGVSIRYGKNLTKFTHEIDEADTYSAVVPYWVSLDDPEDVVTYPGIVYAGTLQTASSEWTDEDGEVVEDESENAVEVAYVVSEVIPLDLSEEFEERPTPEELKARAQAKMAGSTKALPVQNIDIDFVHLHETTEYAEVAPLQRVRLCDWVTVVHPQVGTNIKVKVIKTVYDVLNERYTQVVLGQPKSSFAGVVKNQTEILLQSVPTRSMLKEAVDGATAAIRGGIGGHVVIPDGNDELLIMDTDDVATAMNVLRANMLGLGFSQNGYNGPFSVAITLDGHIVADYIDTGVLTANLIKAGVLSDMSGKFYLDLSTGQLRMNDGTFTGKIESATEVNIVDGNGRKDLSMNGDGLEVYDTSTDPPTLIGHIRVQSAGSSHYFAIHYYEDASLGFRIEKVDANDNVTTVLRIWDSYSIIVTPYSIQCDELRAQTAVTTPSLTVNGRSYDPGVTTLTYNGITVNLYRRGGMVWLYMYSQGTTSQMYTSGSDVSIGTIPDGYRPAMAIDTFVKINKTYHGDIMIGTDGAFSFGYTTRDSDGADVDLPAGTTCYATLVYPV